MTDTNRQGASIGQFWCSDEKKASRHRLRMSRAHRFSSGSLRSGLEEGVVMNRTNWMQCLVRFERAGEETRGTDVGSEWLRASGHRTDTHKECRSACVALRKWPLQNVSRKRLLLGRQLWRDQGMLHRTELLDYSRSPVLVVVLGEDAAGVLHAELGLGLADAASDMAQGLDERSDDGSEGEAVDLSGAERIGARHGEWMSVIQKKGIVTSTTIRLSQPDCMSALARSAAMSMSTNNVAQVGHVTTSTGGRLVLWLAERKPMLLRIVKRRHSKRSCLEESMRDLCIS